MTRPGWLGSSWRQPANPQRAGFGPGGVALARWKVDLDSMHVARPLDAYLLRLVLQEVSVEAGDRAAEQRQVVAWLVRARTCGAGAFRALSVPFQAPRGATSRVRATDAGRPMRVAPIRGLKFEIVFAPSDSWAYAPGYIMAPPFGGYDDAQPSAKPGSMLDRVNPNFSPRQRRPAGVDPSHPADAICFRSMPQTGHGSNSATLPSRAMGRKDLSFLAPIVSNRLDSLRRFIESSICPESLFLTCARDGP